MSEKKEYVDVEIVEVVSKPEVEGKFFTAKCKVAGKEGTVRIRGFATKKDCIAVGKVISASWSEEYGNYFTIGEARRAGGSSSSGREYTPRFSDTREGFLLQQRCIMAQNALTNAINFLHGLPGEKVTEFYTSQNAVKLASAFFHALWADATSVPGEDSSKEGKASTDGKASQDAANPQ